MARDYRTVIAALERKRDDPSVGKEEREALSSKISELRAKYKVTTREPVTLGKSVDEWLAQYMDDDAPWPYARSWESRDESVSEDYVEEDYQYDNEQSDW